MFKKTMSIVLISLVVALLFFYIYLWLASNKNYPVEYGISFNRQHAESIGLDWQEVYLAMLKELKPKYIRIAATWDETEKIAGVFDFSAIDWQMEMADKYEVKVVLVVGQKAPRWPECHVPKWTKDLSGDEYPQSLFLYIMKVAERYKDHPALEIWQVENEPFIRFKFGECNFYQEKLVGGEINLIRQIDNNHKIIITDSGELSFWYPAAKKGDLFGTTLYRIVRTPGGHIFSYDWLPAAFYRFKAGLVGRDVSEVFVSELQAEPWFDNGDPNSTSVDIQMETMNIERLQKHFDYTERIGVSRTYLWGVEWWYWMKEKQGDDSFWKLVRERI